MAHEAMHRDNVIEGSSNRSFGLVFAAVFLIIALWPLMSKGSVRTWSLIIAGIFAALAFIAPSVLGGMNRAWMKLGLLMGRVVSPIALGLLFFVVFTPIGWLFRLAGKDPLRLRKPEGSTYWINRSPPGPKPESLKNQF
jgi:O-antigen/teichoic acid export membrane protein